MKKTKHQRLREKVDQRTTQPRTACGKSFEHEWHIFTRADGRATCDGTLR